MTGKTEHEAQIQAFGTYLEERKKSPGTVQGVLLDLGQFADFLARRDKPFNELTEVDVNEFGKELREGGKSEKLIHRKYKAIKSFYKRLAELGESADLDEVISESRSYIMSLPRPLTIDEMKRFVIACGDVKRRAIFTTMYEAGLRPDELSRLMQEDISWDDLFMVVKNKEGERDRLVFFSRKLKDLLKKYIRSHKSKLPNVFVEDKTTAMRVGRLQVLFIETAKDAKIEGHIALSSLRRSLAAHMIEQGIDIGHVAQMLGLKNTTSLEVLVPAGGVRQNEYQKFISALDL
ncbi:tyrosine-type recombinase/integrase [Tumebacillus permanentifrigoris]|uniref:Site-specific recombinase XerD n=1 Tax=Tumebacillus permanentifrigoris TaxID=378543 RepID=A0A316D7H6_9BACL|nr:tyrosine-type recombinase/integrase [Tumebacillus permanentifrigoris]PWK10225.1 site-specific recombinase XerD [Tumebacillus permanentifrigoris]